jgi:hypothetical protein
VPIATLIVARAQTFAATTSVQRPRVAVDVGRIAAYAPDVVTGLVR